MLVTVLSQELTKACALQLTSSSVPPVQGEDIFYSWWFLWNVCLSCESFPFSSRSAFLNVKRQEAPWFSLSGFGYPHPLPEANNAWQHGAGGGQRRDRTSLSNMVPNDARFSVCRWKLVSKWMRGWLPHGQCSIFSHRWSVIPFTAFRFHRRKAKFLRAGRFLCCQEFLVPVGNGAVDTHQKEDFLNLITVERL